MIVYRKQTDAANPLDALLSARRSLRDALRDRGMIDQRPHQFAPLWQGGLSWMTNAEFAAYDEGLYTLLPR